MKWRVKAVYDRDSVKLVLDVMELAGRSRSSIHYSRSDCQEMALLKATDRLS